MKARTRILISVGSALGIAACASVPQPNAALEGARTEVQTAQANPNVVKYAAVDLQAAEKQLDAAQAAYLRHDDPGHRTARVPCHPDGAARRGTRRGEGG